MRLENVLLPCFFIWPILISDANSVEAGWVGGVA